MVVADSFRFRSGNVSAKYVSQILDLHIVFCWAELSENEGGGQRPFRIFLKIHPFW